MSESQAPVATEDANAGSRAGGSQESVGVAAEKKSEAKRRFSIAFVTEHFVVISAACILASSVLTLDFVFAYLANFDWNLIWIIEYPDLTKFVLIGTALTTAVTFSLTNFAAEILSRMRREQRLRGYVGWMIALYLAVAGFLTYLNRNDAHRQIYEVFWVISALGAGYLVYLAIKDSPHWLGGNVKLLLGDAAVAMFLVATFGTTLAMRIKYAEPVLHDVVTADHKYDRAAIVMLLSHHTILYVDGRTVVVPSASVVSMTSINDVGPWEPDTR